MAKKSWIVKATAREVPDRAASTAASVCGRSRAYIRNSASAEFVSASWPRTASSLA